MRRRINRRRRFAAGGGFEKMRPSVTSCPECHCQNAAGDCYWDNDCCTSDGMGGDASPSYPDLPPCFQAGTEIETIDGFKSIEDIKVGDVVKSYDIKNSKIIESKVYETFKHEDTPNGLLLNGIIKTTTNHPFYSDEKWIDAGNLKLGDKILHVDGEYHTITSLELLDYNITTYNFEVDKTHNYFAEGYLVHNKGGDMTVGVPLMPPKPKGEGKWDYKYSSTPTFQRGGGISGTGAGEIDGDGWNEPLERGGHIYGGFPPSAPRGSRSCTGYNQRDCNSFSSCAWCAPERKCKPRGQCGLGNVNTVGGIPTFSDDQSLINWYHQMYGRDECIDGCVQCCCGYSGGGCGSCISGCIGGPGYVGGGAEAPPKPYRRGGRVRRRRRR